MSSKKGGDLIVCTLVMGVDGKHKVRRLIVLITRWCCCPRQFSCCLSVGKNFGLGTQLSTGDEQVRLANWRMLGENTCFIVNHSLITQIGYDVRLDKFNLWEF